MEKLWFMKGAVNKDRGPSPLKRSVCQAKIYRPATVSRQLRPNALKSGSLYLCRSRPLMEKMSGNKSRASCFSQSFQAWCRSCVYKVPIMVSA